LKKNSSNSNTLCLGTLSVHAGSPDEDSHSPGVTPIYQSSTFKSTQGVYNALKENRARDEVFYTRYGNPSVRAVENKITALENAEDSLAFSSGMGAISAVLETLLKPGDRLVCGRDLYGGTYTLVTERLPETGVEVELVTTDDIEAWQEALSRPAKLVYCESITNPVLKLYVFYTVIPYVVIPALQSVRELQISAGRRPRLPVKSLYFRQTRASDGTRKSILGQTAAQV